MTDLLSTSLQNDLPSQLPKQLPSPAATSLARPLTSPNPALPTDTADPFFFDRCVDWLLSLHASTTDPALQSLAADVLDELREIGPVSGEFADVVLGALASVDVAFELPAAAA